MKPLELTSQTNLKTGLSDEEASHQEKNLIETNPQKPLGRMVMEEVFSYFNIVNYILAVIVIYTGSYRNLLFMGIVVINTIMGLTQKIRSRRVLNKLALTHEQKYQVLRSGKYISLARNEIVQSDLIRLAAGSQIPCDGVIRSGECQTNESLLTGESDALDRSEGQSLYGGCFIVSGSCIMQAVDVGNQQYMAGILKDARREKEYPSQLRDMLNKLIKFCSIIIFPAGIALFCKLFFYSDTPLNPALLNTAASMVGMIPEGLVILTSTALAAAAVKMARRKVLIHELYSIENLARVDVLCLDKTGTITSGNMNVTGLKAENGHSEQEARQMLANLYNALEDDNPTAAAIRAYVKDVHPNLKADKLFPFSSAWKCSGARFGNETYYAGAYTFLFEHPDPAITAQIDQYAHQGLRVLVLAKGGQADQIAKGDYDLCALILIEDEIRPDAKETLDYFKKQDVDLKVISGDMAATVETIARKAGIIGKAIDMSTVPDDRIGQAVATHSIFGRVTPMQKKLMVKALQKQDHTVGMTGDGVNDVMALKQADCSIAMGSGAQAAMSVASMVLLEDQFSVLPSVVLQGRRVINNIQRTASLFLVKTLFSFILTFLTVCWMQAYPFVPIELTLVSSIGTGVPAFLLTFENDTTRPKGNFMISVLSRAIPGGLALSAGISIVYCFVQYGNQSVSIEQYQTICTWLAAINAIGVLYLVCQPLSLQRTLVLGLSVLMAAGAFLLIPSVFMLKPLSWPLYLLMVVIAAGTEFLLWYLWHRPWKRILSRFRWLLKEHSQPA